MERPRVLIVDDCIVTTRLLGKLLERHGYRINMENDPTKAHYRALKFEPDVIILDRNMPWKTGEEVAADLALDDILCGTPIILLTGYALEAGEVSPYPVLLKPFSAEELLDTVSGAIWKTPRVEALAGAG